MIKTLSKIDAVRSALALVAGLAVSGCASKVMKSDQADALLRSSEYEQSMTVKEIPSADSAGDPNVVGLYVRIPGPEPVPGAFAPTANSTSGSASGSAGANSPKSKSELAAALKAAKADKASKAKVAKTPTGKIVMPTVPLTPAAAAAAAIQSLQTPPGAKREPLIEDASGYNGRRPIVDPFRVGEKVTLEVSYFSVVAGDMTVETRGFAEVNGRKSYRFAGTAKSTSVFAMFYAIEDWFETFVDFETLVPVSYALHVKETKQLREVRTLFDWVAKKARYFDKKINDENKLEEKNEEWDIPDYSQNVFSAVYYLRTFDLKPGFKTQFRVAHEGKNLILNAEVVRREKISTAAGEFNTVVIKPTISLDGKFSPVGDIYVWVTDDERKLMVRIESKIKIGKIVGVAKAIEYGKP